MAPTLVMTEELVYNKNMLGGIAKAIVSKPVRSLLAKAGKGAYKNIAPDSLRDIEKFVSKSIKSHFDKNSSYGEENMKPVDDRIKCLVKEGVKEEIERIANRKIGNK